MKVYDAFMFFNELELLELRLELLYDKIDHFVISECDHTFSGVRKPFYYEENKKKFAKYADKIIYLKNEGTDDISSIPSHIRNSELTANGTHYWCREWMQREFAKKALTECKDDDIILSGDLDEIPDPNNIPVDGKLYCLKQHNMVYYANWHNISENWVGTQILPYKFVKENTINECRRIRFSFNAIESGWHLSYMGGPDRVKTKIKSYSHQEFNNQSILGRVEHSLSNKVDVLGRRIEIKNIELNELYSEKAIEILIRHNFVK